MERNEHKISEELVGKEIKSCVSYLITRLAQHPDFMEEVLPVCIQDQDSNSDNDDDPIALEHWIVSDYLADRLQEQGEMVANVLGMQVWGRTCTGQAIALDDVIRKIAKESR
ncbi:MAG: hypothetical protein DRZ76_01730 [Candidatus Nealsonbacteria bacterium]|nr:MAG: hypothetical protein DRZ76_01730 [Candidatus Nealsonbacteria bacterium]